MSTVSRTDFDIYLGFWTEWGQGRVNGATLTLTRRDGGFLMSFLAIFIALSGKSFWRICCFAIHRTLSTTTPQDGLYHQRQAILRNADTPEYGAWKLFQSLFAWRKSARSTILRILPLAVLASFTFTALLVGGIISSRIQTDGGSEVLLTGNQCGPLDWLALNSDTILKWQIPLLSQRSTAYSNYALQCYTDASNSEDCHLFVKPQISTAITRNASCPFAEDICKTKDENIIVDSGYINSHHDLGINSPPEERFEFRLRHHCGPLISDGFKTSTNFSDDPDSPDVVQYWYGNLTKGHRAIVPEDYTGFTYEVLRNFTQIQLPGYTTPVSSRIEYKIGLAASGGGIYDFDPVPELVRDDANIIIFFLDAQGMAFSEAVDDPWFSAHEQWVKALTSDDYDQTKDYLYLTDEPASALACAGQVQFCNPNLPNETRCEPLRSLYDIQVHDPALWSANQMDALSWMESSIFQEFVDPAGLVASIGPNALAARYNIANGLSGPLPNNQWQIEVEHFLGTALASLQGTIVESTNGPRSQDIKRIQMKPQKEQHKKMCRNQKIRSTQYSSFTVLPLATILILGTMLIATDLLMESALDWYQDRRSKGLPLSTITRSAHSRLEWHAMSFLQLQRMAHEGIGSGTWLKTTGETPITRPYEKLGMLDIRDQKRPLLRSSTEELEEWYAKQSDPKVVLTSQTTLTKFPTESEKGSETSSEVKSAKDPEKVSISKAMMHCARC